MVPLRARRGMMREVRGCSARRVGMVVLLASLSAIAFASCAGRDVDEASRPGAGDVVVSANGVRMPLNRILLVRKDGRIGAVKFVADGFRVSRRFLYADYEEYLRKDETGGFAAANVVRRKRTAYALFIASPIILGNFAVECGPAKLFWTGGRNVRFFKGNGDEGGAGIELAPTPWTDISQVDLSDPRIGWYRHQPGRKRVTTPVDALWSRQERGAPAR